MNSCFSNIKLTSLDFGRPRGGILGLMSSIYSLGAVCALPFIPFMNDRFGRRWTIVGSSLIMILGAMIQGFANNSQYIHWHQADKTLTRL